MLCIPASQLTFQLTTALNIYGPQCPENFSFSAIAGDSKPPSSLAWIQQKKKKQKETEVFAISEVCTVHWKDAEFDIFKIHSIPIPFNYSSPSEHDFVDKFIKTPLNRIGEYASQYEETKFMLAHIQIHHNELFF